MKRSLKKIVGFGGGGAIVESGVLGGRAVLGGWTQNYPTSLEKRFLFLLCCFLYILTPWSTLYPVVVLFQTFFRKEA